jgi:hypothetical protein
MKTKTLFLILFVSGLAQANDCSDFYERLGFHNAYRQTFSDGSCSISVNPDTTTGMIYRSFSFNNFGSLMVFNSFGPEENATSTGARVYYFFPRTQNPSLIIENESFSIQTASPDVRLKFSKTTGQVLELSTGSVSEDATVDPKNKGGLQLKNTKGLMLDSGFAMGQDPSALPKNSSVFTDGAGHSCTVVNSKIYKYFGSGDVQFAFTDAELDILLKKLCPQLIYSFN